MSDPTAFAIEFDPRESRMRGVAIHGHTPFDVPFISPIADNLWQGGCTNSMILPEEIEHVVSLYPWEQYRKIHQLKSLLSVALYDDLSGPVTDQIVAIARWVNVCRQSGPTLVHCQAGLNRSGMVAAVALMLEGLTAPEAIELLRQTRSPAVLCNPTFEKFLLELEL